MEEIGDDISLDALESVYARTIWRLRESRKAILLGYAIADEVALLKKIGDGQVVEHPAYEHYLGSLILEQTRAQVQAEMTVLAGGRALVLPALSVHVELKNQLERHFSARMSEAPRLAPDALNLAFDTGLLMELRYYSKDEYCVNWWYGDHALRLDTAPIHAGQTEFPRHLHAADGTLMPDELTRPGAGCWENFSRLMKALLVDPLLENRTPARLADGGSPLG